MPRRCKRPGVWFARVRRRKSSWQPAPFGPDKLNVEGAENIGFAFACFAHALVIFPAFEGFGGMINAGPRVAHIPRSSSSRKRLKKKQRRACACGSSRHGNVWTRSERSIEPCVVSGRFSFLLLTVYIHM